MKSSDKPKRTSWRALARAIAKRLPVGYVRLQTEPHTKPTGRRVSIVAHYAEDVAPVEPFTVNVRGNVHSIKVRMQRTAPLRRFTATAANFNGVFPGATIAADLGGGTREWGAICSFLSASPTDPQPSHLVTCGHMFPPGATGTQVLGGPGAQVIGALERNLLNLTHNPRDVALVVLNPAGRTLATAGGAGPQLQDYVPETQIFSLSVQTYRPTTSGYSPLTTTATATTPSAHIPAALWPNGFSVEDVIATATQVSNPGDSGTILATPDPIAVGSCTASGGGQSLFEPLGRVIDNVFQPQLNLTLWRNP